MQLRADIRGARILALLGDDVTTDHISPVSRIPPDSEAAAFLLAGGTPRDDLQSYSARRVNHEVMARGTLANLRLRNRLAGGREGGFTWRLPDGGIVTIHQAEMEYRKAGVASVVIAGRNYGAGSARDWAAKGMRILGIRAVIARGFERIQRANVIAMGVLPLTFPEGMSAEVLGLTGEETVDLIGLPGALRPGGIVAARIGDHRVELICGHRH